MCTGDLQEKTTQLRTREDYFGGPVDPYQTHFTVVLVRQLVKLNDFVSFRKFFGADILLPSLWLIMAIFYVYLELGIN